MKITKTLLNTLPSWAQNHIVEVKKARQKAIDQADFMTIRAAIAERLTRDQHTEIRKLQRRINELESVI